MRIAIDGKFAAAPRTGVQRYADDISRRLLALRPDRYRLLVPPWSEAGTAARGAARRILRWGSVVWEQGWLPIKASMSGYDRLYCPGNMSPALSSNTVLVLHDILPLTHAEWFSHGFARWARVMFPWAVRRARWVITDSHASEAAILGRFPFLEGRLSVVYPGIGEQFTPASTAEIESARRRYGLERRYLLFLGTLDPRKNLHRVLAAWRSVGPDAPDVELVICGMSSEVFQGSSARGRDLSGLSRVRWLGFVPDADLPALLSGCEAMVYASLDEGFGFPPLEAMACGRPAIVSTAGSLPEVCGEAALYADPLSEASIAEGMRTALRSSTALAPLIQAGLAQASRYRWAEAARETDEILTGLG